MNGDWQASAGVSPSAGTVVGQRGPLPSVVITSIIDAERCTQIRRGRVGLTIVELLTILAFLIVVLGLLVSLARYVRATSAQDLTRRTLAELDDACNLVHPPSSTQPTLEAVRVPTGVALDEVQFQQYVVRTSVPIVRRVLSNANDRRATEAAAAADEGNGVRVMTNTLAGVRSEGERVVRDAWGNPIAYLPGQHPNIGMAPQNRPFFVSAGPDGKYLTRDDNLYSYEQMRIVPSPDRTSDGGHRE